ncbi:IclR family transcriptional regulator [Desertihabitans aurantiacus]|uniref:IclR family transcriptional regulator n=1 Tax=Desertihabitans aurantiacus TaxID=2282477 RepID=UPI0018E520A2|nr:IclR family transcriptional regulator [Desertihabitans aurantiacus]
MPDAPSAPPAVKSAERTLEILQTVARWPGQLTAPELARHLGYPRSSLHALVRTLESGGWLHQEPGTGRLRVGAQALVSGSAYLDGETVLPYAQDAVEEVRSRTGHTSHYARLVGGDVLYLTTRYASTRDTDTFRVGRSLPATATALGQVLLAERTDDEVRALVPATLPQLTEHTLTDPVALAAAVEQARTRGWAVEREQSRAGRVCVAVAVHHRIPATDAISCAMDAEQATQTEVRRTAEELVAARDRLTATLRREGVR